MKLWHLCIIVLLVGCSERAPIMTYTNTSDEALQSKIAELVQDADEIDEANVFVAENDVFIALQLKPLSKWKKQKIEKKWQKKLEKQFEDKSVLVSTDFKLYWETSKLLEEKNQQKVQQKLQKLKQLAKEET